MPDRKARILVLTTEAHGGFGGIAVYNEDLVNALAAQPWCGEVVVVPRLIRSEPTGVPANVTMVSSASKGKAAYALSSARQIFSSYDMVICGHVNLLPFAKPLARLKGVPLVNILYGIDAWEPTGRPLADMLIRHCDLHLSISPTTTERFCKWTGVPASAVAPLPNAIEQSNYGMGAKPAYLIERYNVGARRVVMSLGRLAGLERQKGMDELIELMPRLRERAPDVMLLIVGDGDDRARLEAKVDAMAMREHIVFAGRIPDAEKADHYRLCDVFSMVGRQEGFGFVFLEALATGAGAIGSIRDGSRDALLNGELGLLADPDEPGTIEDAILQLLDKPRHIPERLDHYSFDNFQRRLDEALSPLLPKECLAV